jgi:ankyrin repeat protein
MQRDLNGLLPVHYAMLAGHANLLFVFFEYYENYLELINNESDTNQSLDSLKPLDRLVDAKGFSLLHFSCFNGHSTCTETICDLGENYPFLIEMFVETDSDSNMYNKFSPLHCACFSSHDTCVSIVLEKFCDKSKTLIELEDQNGNRPLHICAMNNEYDCALLLIEANCSLNQPNLRGHTPFMLAAAYSSFNIMEMLLSDEREKKIDLSSTDLKGNTALHLALLNNHENCALFLLDKIEPSSLIVNQQNHQGQTPLHLAASKGMN